LTVPGRLRTLADTMSVELERRRVLDLVLRHGWNATACQTLAPGYRYFFEGDGCVAYADTGAAWVGAGVPIAGPTELAGVAAGFGAAARAAGRRHCFFASEERFVQAVPALATLFVGEQPVWDPRDWRATLRRHAGLRAQLRHARAQKVQVREVGPGEPRAGSALAKAIDGLVAGWLGTRRMPPMGFLLRVERLAVSDRRRCFVADQGGTLVGLVYVVPVPRRNGWFIEHMVRARRAPYGTVELLVDAVMRAAAEQDSGWLTLGMAPLSGDVSLSLQVARRRLSFLYNFDGLRRFKAKLHPREWQRLYISYPPAQGAALTLIDVLAAFAANAPARGARLSP
jgi:phosphatidylglycerol lysyltransferase